jgi:HlyD family secretion protein
MREHKYVAVAAAALLVACGNANNKGATRATGYVEATEVRVASQVAGKVLEVKVDEGDRVSAGALLVRVDPTDLQLALDRVKAERTAADAQLRLLQAGARPEELRQAEAQVAAADADQRATQSELKAASDDLARFESLLAANAGSEKQRDDAAARRELAAARVKAAGDRAQAARETLARLRSGARSQELDAARARVAAADAEIASLQKNIGDTQITAPVSGVVTTRLVDPGELVSPGTPTILITDLDHAWANVYVDEPVVPTLKIGEKVTVLTDAGQRMDGDISFISPRAEFTPRNVQTANERAKLVYRVKVLVDNRAGVLKPGMPVEADLSQPASPNK